MSVFKSSLVATALVLAAAAARPAAAQAAAHPNYSGTWDLDVAASNFGPMPSPTKMSMTVRQTADSVIITTNSSSAQMGDQTVTNGYLVGGPATAQMVGGGMQAQASAKWDGPTLTMLAVVQQQGMEIPVNSRWALSPDGKTLTVARTISTPGGEMSMTLVTHKR